MEAIKDTIKDVMVSWEKKLQHKDNNDPEAWLRKALTKKEIGHASFGYFKGGIFNIKADSSSWLYYFNLQRDKILSKLRKTSNQVKGIRLSLGEKK